MVGRSRRREKLGVIANGYGVPFLSDQNVLDQIVVMVAQLCEITKNHRVVYFERTNFMVCELYFNKAVIKTQWRVILYRNLKIG